LAFGTRFRGRCHYGGVAVEVAFERRFHCILFLQAKQTKQTFCILPRGNHLESICKASVLIHQVCENVLVLFLSLDSETKQTNKQTNKKTKGKKEKKKKKLMKRREIGMHSSFFSLRCTRN